MRYFDGVEPHGSALAGSPGPQELPGPRLRREHDVDHAMHVPIPPAGPSSESTGSSAALVRDIILLGLIWGASVVLQRVALADVPPLSLVMLRLLASLAFFLPFLPSLARTLSRARPRALFDLAVVGALNPTASAVFSALALQYASSGVVSVLASSSAIVAAALSHFVLREVPLRPYQRAGLFAAFFGVAVVIGAGHSGLGSEAAGDHRGHLLALLVALSQALSGLYAGRRVVGTDPLTLAAGQTVAGLIFILPLALLGEGPIALGAISPLAWLAIILSGAIGLGASFILLANMVKRWGPTGALLGINVTPLTATGLGVLFLGETLSGQTGFGALLVLAGIFLFSRR